MKFFFLLLLFHVNQISSQEKKLDSIRDLLENYSKRDSNRVNLLNKVTLYYTTRDISKNQTILKEAISISKEINYNEGLIKSYTNLSSLYTQEGNYDKGLKLALLAKEEQVKTGDINGLVYSNTTIARIYSELKKPKKAIEILKQSLSLLKNKPNSNIKANAFFYLGNTYLSLGSLNKARESFLEAKKIAINNKFLLGVHIANSTLGVIETKRGNFIEATNYLNVALKFYEKNNQTNYMAHTYLCLADAYKGLKKFGTTNNLNLKAIEIYKKQGNLKNLERAYFGQYEVFELEKKYKKANFYLLEHYKMKDSIFSTDKMKTIEEMQTKYETEKIEKEKILAERSTEIANFESRKNRDLFLGSLIIGVLLIIASLFYFSTLKEKKKAEIIVLELKETQKRLALEKQYKDSELKALKAQMNPHFIFNALNSIQDYIVLNKKSLASDYLGKFADLIRNYLHFSNTGFISLKDEVYNLNLYLELEKLRFEEELQYTIKEDDTINLDAIKIPTMLLQPYVENALKHGLLHRKKDRKLTISFLKTSNEIIECVIQDNGIGRKRAKEIKSNNVLQHKSFASKATSERLSLLNFGKEQKIGVKIFDLKERNIALGTKVILNIPIIKI